MNKRVALLPILVFLVIIGFAQSTITGKVTSATTGDPIPFANVYVKGTSYGVTTNFDGYYSLRLKTMADSITVSYV